VIILFHKDHAAELLFSAGGPDHAAKRLQNVNVPTAYDKEIADLVLDSLHSCDSPKRVASMGNVALKWRDLGMWKEVVKTSGSLISIFGINHLRQVWEAFTFECVRAR
jgi:hypothetical protein